MQKLSKLALSSIVKKVSKKLEEPKSEISDESSSDESEYEKEPLEPKILPERSTRGVKITNESNNDADFWTQKVWKDGGNSEFSESTSDYDSYDSDMDASEDEESEGEVKVTRETKQKKSSYNDPNAKKKGSTVSKKGLSSILKKLQKTKEKRAMLEKKVKKNAKKDENKDKEEKMEIDGEDDADSENEEESSDEESEVPLEPKILPKRSTRGVKLSDESQNDADFWTQKVWKDGGNSEFSESTSDYDSSDSDIDASEAEESESEVKVKREKKGGNKSTYKDPTMKKSKISMKLANIKSLVKKNLKVKTEVEGGSVAATPVKRKAGRPPKSSASSTPTALQERKLAKQTTVNLRESTQMKRKAIDHELKNEPPIQRRRTGPKRRVQIPQDQLMVEAAQTEVFNQNSLEQLLKIAEDKKTVFGPKQGPSGPTVKRISKEGKTYFIFSEDLPEIFTNDQPETREKGICPITGRPARYFDRLTEMPYYNLHAFKQIRAAFAEEKKTASKPKEKENNETVKEENYDPQDDDEFVPE